jgi:hypothetical protein
MSAIITTTRTTHSRSSIRSDATRPQLSCNESHIDPSRLLIPMCTLLMYLLRHSSPCVQVSSPVPISAPLRRSAVHSTRVSHTPRRTTVAPHRRHHSATFMSQRRSTCSYHSSPHSMHHSRTMTSGEQRGELPCGVNFVLRTKWWMNDCTSTDSLSLSYGMSLQ